MNCEKIISAEFSNVQNLFLDVPKNQTDTFPYSRCAVATAVAILMAVTVSHIFHLTSPIAQQSPPSQQFIPDWTYMIQVSHDTCKVRILATAPHVNNAREQPNMKSIVKERACSVFVNQGFLQADAKNGYVLTPQVQSKYYSTLEDVFEDQL